MALSLFLCLALCVDIFVAGVVYGADRILVSFRKNVIMNGIGTGCLGLALCFGSMLSLLIPDFLAAAVCFVSLFLIGMSRLLDSLIKNYLNRHCSLHKNIRFSFSELKFILQIYADPSCADRDSDRVISAKEAVLLGFAMSIDSLCAGTFAAFLDISVGWTLIFSFLSGTAAMSIGQLAGQHMAKRMKADLTWIGGLLLILLAFGQLLI